MSTSKLFEIKTAMSKEDYRNFLYISTFFKNKFTIIKMILFILSISIFCTYRDNSFKVFFIAFILLSLVFVSMLLIGIELKINKRFKTDAAGIFNSNETLYFYSDYILVNSSVFEGEIKVKYNQIYKVFESKNYVITYFNINQATLINKGNLDISTISDLRNIYKINLKGNYIHLKI